MGEFAAGLPAAPRSAFRYTDRLAPWPSVALHSDRHGTAASVVVAPLRGDACHAKGGIDSLIRYFGWIYSQDAGAARRAGPTRFRQAIDF